MRPRDNPPPFGFLMDALTAAKELQRAGLLSKKERKALVAWINDPNRQQPSPELSAVIWAVWMWQMAPGSWALH